MCLGLVIPDIFTNLVSCYRFVKYSISTIILTCLSDLVTYYLSEEFVMVETYVGWVDNIPTTVRIQTHADNLHKEDSLLTLNTVIPSIVNTLSKIIIE